MKFILDLWNANKKNPLLELKMAMLKLILTLKYKPNKWFTYKFFTKNNW